MLLLSDQKKICATNGYSLKESLLFEFRLLLFLHTFMTTLQKVILMTSKYNDKTNFIMFSVIYLIYKIVYQKKHNLAYTLKYKFKIYLTIF